MENRFWYLKRSRFFERASDELVRECEHLFTQRLVAARAPVFASGEGSRSVALIKRGSVKVSRTTEDGKEILVALLRAGDLFGEEVLLSELPVERTNGAVCIEESLICVAYAPDLYGLMMRHPALTMNVAKYLREQRDDALSIVEDIAYLRVQDRLTRLLERLAREYGTPVSDGTKVDVRLTHSDLAALIGSTRETVTLQISGLTRDGYLRTHEKHLVLLRPLPTLV